MCLLVQTMEDGNPLYIISSRHITKKKRTSTGSMLQKIKNAHPQKETCLTVFKDRKCTRLITVFIGQQSQVMAGIQKRANEQEEEH